ncbi:MAG: rhodanese-like domain-containing protein, partial [Anaerolineae bacterium]|nr:rhodanese-like domain-containing protein [Anaerolineae bacterium]
ECMEMRGERHWVIVDVRSEVEREVSIIPGAIAFAEFQAYADAYLGQPVLVYCTVGCRSATHTHNLREQGVEAYNLWGGVVDWAEYGGKFTTLTGQRTKKCTLTAGAGICYLLLTNQSGNPCFKWPGHPQCNPLWSGSHADDLVILM